MQNFKKMCADVAEEMRRVGANSITVANTLGTPGADLKGSIDLLTGMNKECFALADTLDAAAKSIPDLPDLTAHASHPHKAHAPAHPHTPAKPSPPASTFDPARPPSPNDPDRPSDPNPPNKPFLP